MRDRVNPSAFVLWIGAALLVLQCGWYLYSAEWLGFSLLMLTGTYPDQDWESWHGLRDILSYIPLSGTLFLWGGILAVYEQMDRDAAEAAKQHVDYLTGNRERP